MSTQTMNTHIPQFDMSDRMRKTLRASGLSVQEIADEFGISRNTVSSWINGHVTPPATAIRLWAIRFEVPLQWLLDGTEPPPEPDGPDGGIPAPAPIKRGRKKLPHLDSNQKPFDYRLASAA